jgi:hypothetical protein
MVMVAGKMPLIMGISLMLVLSVTDDETLDKTLEGCGFFIFSPRFYGY